ncbi:MAG TPA: rod shape-determining protein MreC [Tepidisphaeraceae bacterium]|jgi:cell shape-determining protein MreC|nr:rod shape-determining protein MreC [Tepidisphaeraceae bacterium]
MLRFSHIFAGLMVISLLAAFALPAQSADQHYPELSLLFAPVAWPAARIGQWLRRRTPVIVDSRPDAEIRRENMGMRAELTWLTQQLERLERLNHERLGMGQIGQYCAPVGVVGADSGARQSLLLRGSTILGLRDGMCVLYDGWIVGQIARSGLGGAQVRLITDPGSRERVRFRGIVTDAAGRSQAVRRGQLIGVAEGIGQNAMVIRELTGDDVKAAGVAVGDLVTLDEPDWPSNVQGLPLGRVTAISPRPDAPLYAQIEVDPQVNLLRLREVMVVVKE